MTKIRFTTVCVVLFLFVFAGLSLAAVKIKSERWYGVYYQGKKVGFSSTLFTDFEKDGKKLREIKTTTFARVTGKATYTGGGKSLSKNWTFKLNQSSKAVLEKGKVVSITAKSTGTKAPILRAKSKTENGALVIHRTEGVVTEDIVVKPDDYDLVSDPAQTEPYLETLQKIGDKDSKRIFSLTQAEVRVTTIERLEDNKTKDENGDKKPCKVFKLMDDDIERTIKTVQGRIVYNRSKDLKNQTSVFVRMMAEKRAKSETGY